MDVPFLTIYVTLEGMGFACFNARRGGAEIAFLRLPRHELRIDITGSNGRKWSSADSGGIADDAKIELPNSRALINKFRLNKRGGFYRKRGIESDNDPLDLRWLLDLESEEMHGGKASLTKPPRDGGSVRALTRMFLPNAHFFAEQVLPIEYMREETNSPAGTDKPKDFGFIGDTLGAKIDATSASLKINENDIFRFHEDAKPDEVTRFFVNISNVCSPLASPTATQSDFPKYYEVLSFPNDRRRFDFKPPEASPQNSNKTDDSGDELTTNSLIFFPKPAFCDFVYLGQTDSLGSFFE